MCHSTEKRDSIGKTESPDILEILPDYLLFPREGTLINHVFGDQNCHLKREGVERIGRGTIFCPENDDCLNINRLIDYRIQEAYNHPAQTKVGKGNRYHPCEKYRHQTNTL